MAEEAVIEPNVNNPVESDNSVDTSIEYTEQELQAMEEGWKPKEQYAGDEKKWVDAEEFLRRGELFKKIDVMGKELKENKKALRMLQEHHAKVREAEYQRALNELKSQKRAAFTEGDADRILEIDDQISDLKALQIAEHQAIKQQVSKPDPRFVAWVERNGWYAQDPELRSFADETGLSYNRLHPEKDPEEVLKYVEGRIRKAFPEKFTNPNRVKTNAVESSSPARQSRKSDDIVLSEEERRVMNTFVRAGIMSAEDYKAELKRVRG